MSILKEFEKDLLEKVKKAGYEFASYDDPRYFQHGYPSNVKYFVDRIDQKIVIGYHGSYPERILAKNGYNFVPELYATYTLENGRMVKI